MSKMLNGAMMNLYNKKTQLLTLTAVTEHQCIAREISSAVHTVLMYSGLATPSEKQTRKRRRFSYYLKFVSHTKQTQKQTQK